MSYLSVVFLLVIVVGVVLLQVFLSKQENKWLGLILPIVTFGISLIGFLSVLFFSPATATYTKNGQVVTESINSLSSIILMGLYGVVIWNIPNVVFLPIYIGVRSKYSKNKSVGKMNIQDL